MLVLTLVFQLVESLTDGFFCQGRYPQPFHRTLDTRFLLHPALNQFSLLSRIAAVDNLVRLTEQPLYGIELFLYAFVLRHLYPETGRDHGQRTHGPTLPLRIVVVRVKQRAQVTKSPGYLVTVAFHVTVPLGSRAQHSGDVSTHGGFLCNANYHSLINLYTVFRIFSFAVSGRSASSMGNPGGLMHTTSANPAP